MIELATTVDNLAKDLLPGLLHLPMKEVQEKVHEDLDNLVSIIAARGDDKPTTLQ